MMQNDVYNLLTNLNKTDALKELVCSCLNYQYIDRPLSKRRWKDSLTQAVKQLNLIGSVNNFHIIYCQIDRLQCRLGLEREIINRLLKDYYYSLFVFSDESNQNWHFVNVKYDEEQKNRRLFRRIIVGPDERLHTAAQRISLLQVTDESMPPLALQKQHDEAFDVEKVTKEFYERYTEIFHALSGDIAEENPREDTYREAQIILDRLVFLYFIQKKGWLNNNKRYLYENFLKHWREGSKSNTFYKDFLVKLFQSLSCQGDLYRDKLGDIPFLNGGLFEVDPFHSKLPFRLVIRNDTFKQIFDDLLERFNFTVREDTPLDVEVAIDPEMLGKIFENLVLKLEKGEDLRKKTGSYYTPRIVVHFMCQQALKEYLATEWEKHFVAKPVEEGKLPLKDVRKQREIYDTMIEKQEEEHKKKLQTLLQFDPAEQLDQEKVDELKSLITLPEADFIRETILKASILDPAAGSGAFLVGMLHQMIHIIKLLDLRKHGWDYIHRINYDCDLKKQIIENCLYGVDIQEQAVRICELRLWLSLIVDYEKVKGEEMPPLPNLSYRIRCGDSLIEKLFGHNVQLDRLVQTDKGKRLIDEIREDKEAYFLARDIQEKNRIELRTLAKQCELMQMLIKTKKDSFAPAGAQRLFFEETAKERKAREEFEKTMREYENILLSSSNTRKKVEAMLKGKIPIPAEDIHNLKRKLGISFIWKLDFAEVFKEKDGFDVVIANPPYVNIRNLAKYLAKGTKEFFDSIFFSAKKGYDYYVLFIEKGLSLNRKNGIFCFIMPNKIQTINYAETMREYLLKQTSLRYIVDVSNIKIFKEASVYPNILITKMASCQENGRISIGVGFKEAEEVVRYDRYFLKKQSDFLKNPQFIFSLTDKMGSNLLEKIKSKSVPLSNLCKLHAGTTGFSASNINKCIVDKPESNDNELDFIVTGNIDRYVIHLGNVHYMKKLYQRPILRYDRKYITDGKWKLFASPKIVIGGMTKRIEAAYDSVGYAIGVGLSVMPEREPLLPNPVETSASRRMHQA